jgi:hypothetical protein
MDLQDRWNKLLKIQDDLDNVITQIREELQKNRLVREEWYIQKSEWLKKNKKNFTLKNQEK